MNYHITNQFNYYVIIEDIVIYQIFNINVLDIYLFILSIHWQLYIQLSVTISFDSKIYSKILYPNGNTE